MRKFNRIQRRISHLFICGLCCSFMFSKGKVQALTSKADNVKAIPKMNKQKSLIVSKS